MVLLRRQTRITSAPVIKITENQIFHSDQAGGCKIILQMILDGR